MFIGNHHSIRELLSIVQRLKNARANFLVVGESGTGKELIARLLHDDDMNKTRPFVPINCGAIPENLLESILFGHERGAFSGAIATQIGKFESADGGDIFCDDTKVDFYGS